MRVLFVLTVIAALGVLATRAPQWNGGTPRDCAAATSAYLRIEGAPGANADAVAASACSAAVVAGAPAPDADARSVLASATAILLAAVAIRARIRMAFASLVPAPA